MTKLSALSLKVFLTHLILFLSACGGGGGDNQTAGCDTPLTVDYVNNAFLTEIIFTSDNFSATDTTLIHSDGNQGNDFDIDTIILSRITHTSGNTLAISTSTYATDYPPSGTYMLFFIDDDYDATTGAVVDGIGADVVILDALPDGGDPGPSSSLFYTWDANTSSWLGTATLGTLSSTASYTAGCTLGIAIHVPLYQGIDSLYAKDVRGVMKLARLSNGNPNTPVAAPLVDSTSVFDFTVP